ncbi:MAG: protein-disulfide reductase DsbD domain-containing protein, partial [bacterium]
MILLVFTGFAVRAQMGSGVTLEWTIPQAPAAEQSLLARIEMTIPDNLQVYADEEHFFLLEAVKTTGLRDFSVDAPDPVMVSEAGPIEVEDGKVAVYEEKAVFEVQAEPEGANGDPWEVVVEFRFQTCTPTMCYPPETHLRRWSGTLGADDATVAQVSEEEPSDSAVAPARGDELAIPADFEPAARASGYMGKRKFMQFLAEGKGERDSGGGLADVLQNGSVWLGLLLILVAG